MTTPALARSADVGPPVYPSATDPTERHTANPAGPVTAAKNPDINTARAPFVPSRASTVSRYWTLRRFGKRRNPRLDGLYSVTLYPAGLNAIADAVLRERMVPGSPPVGINYGTPPPYRAQVPTLPDPSIAPPAVPQQRSIGV